MTLRNPNANESIKEYDELQTAEMNSNAQGMNDLESRIELVLPNNSIVESIRTNGSNVGGYTGDTALSLAQSVALPLLWSGLIKINEISSATAFLGTKISASDGGGICSFLLTNNTTYQTYIAVLSESELLSFKEI